MGLILLIVILVILFGGGGGYWGYNRGYYGRGGHGLIWLLVLIVVLVVLFAANMAPPSSAHDAENWMAVFGKDRAPSSIYARGTYCSASAFNWRI